MDAALLGLDPAVPVVVAVAPEGDTAAELAAGALEPVAVPFKQVVLPELYEKTRSIKRIHHLPPD